MAALRGPNSRLRDTIDATGCTYEALAKDVRRIAAENGEILLWTFTYFPGAEFT
ncbi:hypothetical protein ABZS98_39440 [Streptomyces avermitilis]|uniref:hypothetical protein n=1 Tax=Streptomyces avermitilis TaxID=33903 RepID=UPI0033A6DDF8